MFYVLVGIACLIAIIAIFNHNRFMHILGRLGRSSGAEEGPKPGEGAVIHNSSGEADFDGQVGNAPPIKDAARDQPYPPKRAAD
jgi:hypothetical protein